jgi:hypothetical protein
VCGSGASLTKALDFGPCHGAAARFLFDSLVQPACIYKVMNVLQLQLLLLFGVLQLPLVLWPQLPCGLGV